MANSDRKPSGDDAQGANFGGLLDGMANLLGKLGELAEKGEELRRNGNFQSDDGKTVAGSYGFNVRFGPGGERSDEVKVAPVKKTAKPEPKPSKQDTREPQVDLFPESDHILVVAEIPGVRVEDIELDFSENNMTLIGKSARVRFEKTIDLGTPFSPDDVSISMNNGVVEIRLEFPTQGTQSDTSSDG